MRAIVSLLVPALLVFAQSKPESDSVANSTNFRVEGTVTSTTGEPIPSATVRIQPASSVDGLKVYVQTSDAQGRYAFENIAAGHYNLSPVKSGFLPIDIPLNITNGQPPVALELKMVPQGVITGQVTDQNGRAISNVQISVFRFTYIQGRQQPTRAAVAETNDKGEYRVISLLPGRYLVSASDTHFRTTSLKEENVDTFYPNGIDQFSATPLDITAGAELSGIDIHMLRSKVYSVSGKAVVSTGAIPLGTILDLSPKDAPLTSPYRIALRDDGSFVFRNLSPRTYILESAQNSGSLLSGRREVNVDTANIEDLTIQLAQSADVVGTLRLEDGEVKNVLKSEHTQPVPGLLSAVLPGFSAAPANQILIGLRESAGNESKLVRTGTIGSDGTFKIQGARASKYSLETGRLPEGIYVKSVQFRGEDVTHKDIDLTHGTSGSIDVVFSSKAADVSGSVVNEKGQVVPGTTVTLWPSDASNRNDGVMRTTTDQEGKFRFSGLAPDEYYAAAWEDIEPELAMYYPFLARFNNQASPITLVESQHGIVKPRLISSEKVLSEAATMRR